MTTWRAMWVALGFGCCAMHPVSARDVWAGVDLGPLYSVRIAPDGATEQRGLGPVYEHRTGVEGGTLRAIRPLAAWMDTTPVDSRVHRLEEGLFPVWQREWLGPERHWKFLVFWRGTNWDVDDPDSRDATWLFPFWFHGTDVLGQDYAGLFPIYGSVHEFAGRDEIHWALFPLRARTQVGSVVSSKWFWPVYNHTVGNDLERWRIFPLYGWSEWKGQWRNTFFLWPFWTHSQSLDPHRPGGGWMLFPIAGDLHTGAERTTYLLPPLFRWTRGGETDVVHAPWPFVQWSQGAVDKFYLWPLIGKREQEGATRRFLFWPVGRWNTVLRHDEVVQEGGVYPFWIWQDRWPAVDEQRVEGEPPLARTRQLWPLFRYERDGEHTRFRALALWPAKTHEGVERNWAPFWTLVEHERRGEEAHTEALWGLFRREISAGGGRRTALFPLFEWGRDDGPEAARRWSVLKGLLAREHAGDARRWKCLYFIRWGDIPDPMGAADDPPGDMP